MGNLSVTIFSLFQEFSDLCVWDLGGGGFRISCLHQEVRLTDWYEFDREG